MPIPFASALRLSCAALITALAAGCQTPTPLTWPVPEGSKTMPINGYPMTYAEAGRGQTVVFLPGILCDYRCFQGQMALASDYRVVAVSFRRTYPEPFDGTGAGYGLAQNTRDVIALLQTLNPPVVLLGHSFGGAIAARVAQQRPDLVSKLVLAEAATNGVLTAEEQQIRADQNLKFADYVEVLYKSKGKEAAAEFAVDAINGSGSWARLAPPARSVVADDAWTAIPYGRDTSPTASCADLATLKMPVLLVTGQNTGPGFRRIVARQAECLPSARTVTIPGVGHLVQANAPAMNTALKDFMR